MPDAGPLHTFLVGRATDAAGRAIGDVLAFSDAELEARHDFIQWLFPLATPSAAVPWSPVLTEAEILAIRADPAAQENLAAAAARMTRFYDGNDHWLVRGDHNHLRITRIVASLKLLAGREAAADFLAAIEARVEAAGSPVNPTSRRYWRAALGAD
jgi:hypothetical protein